VKSLSVMGQKSAHSLHGSASSGEPHSPQGVRTSGNATLVWDWTVSAPSHRAVALVNHPQGLLGKALMSHYFLESVVVLAGSDAVARVSVVGDGRGSSARLGCSDRSWRLCAGWPVVPVCGTLRYSSADLGRNPHTPALRCDSTHIAACAHSMLQLAFSAPVGASNERALDAESSSQHSAGHYPALCSIIDAHSWHIRVGRTY
jgi:hypothetical protein